MGVLGLGDTFLLVSFRVIVEEETGEIGEERRVYFRRLIEHRGFFSSGWQPSIFGRMIPQFSGCIRLFISEMCLLVCFLKAEPWQWSSGGF